MVAAIDTWAPINSERLHIDEGSCAGIVDARTSCLFVLGVVLPLEPASAYQSRRLSVCASGVEQRLDCGGGLARRVVCDPEIAPASAVMPSLPSRWLEQMSW